MQIDPKVWRVQKTITEHMSVEKRYVLAVSGGADSLTLADAVVEVFAQRRDRLLVCHVEHGIRGEEALKDADLVKNFCREHDLAFVCCHVKALEFAEKKGISLEAAARSLRYASLYEQAKVFGADSIVVAHHADDQAETVLWKLLRGAGIDGLSGMQTVSGQKEGFLLRPFLELKRAEIEEYCALRHLCYSKDTTNEDLTYTRNRIRKELLPYLERNFNPAIKDTLIREAKLLAEEQECLELLADKFIENKSLCGFFAEDRPKLQRFWIDARKLAEQPAALRKRILRKVYFLLGGKELSYERTIAMDKLCLSHIGGKMIQLSDGGFALYKNKQIIISRGDNNNG